MPLGVDMTPLGQKKCIVPEIGAALVSGGASLIGSLLGLGSQSSANAQNLQMQRETNEMNYKIANEANQNSNNQFAQNLSWLKEQYYDTDQYSRLSASLRKAGLNPALALGSANPVGSVGAASPTQFHAAQMEAGHVDPLSYDSLSESVGSAVNAFYDNQYKTVQTESTRLDNTGKKLDLEIRAIENRNKVDRQIQELENLKKEGRKTEKEIEELDERISSLRQQAKLFDDQYDDLVNKPKKENRLLDLQGDSVEQDIVHKKIENMLLPKLMQSQIDLNSAQRKSLVDNLQLIEPTIEKLKAEGKLTDAKSIGEYLMNGQNAIKFLQENHLEEMYNKDGITKKGRDFFYMLGDLLSHGIVKNLPK